MGIETGSARMKKSDQTRNQIIEVSMRLFLQQGFERTTMREIARAAGLAPGAAYYYFESKDHLIFDFYRKSYEDHLAEAERVLREEKKLSRRLAGVIRAHLKVAEPYHEISKVLFKTAADPAHPLSPFSKESKELRDKNIDLLRRVLEGQKLEKDLNERLPEMLWMFKMGMILYWVHDLSPRREKTYHLVNECAELVSQVIQISRLPVLNRLTRKVVDLYYKFKTF
ncbi:MAG: TetR family transcriptional regulator [Terriglobia bacterium]|jgi:AcrR family transcriptional regulator